MAFFSACTRGKHLNRPHAVPLQSKEVARTFIADLQTFRTHYSREHKPLCGYLKPGQSIRNVYSAFVEVLVFTPNYPLDLWFLVDRNTPHSSLTTCSRGFSPLNSI